MTADEVNALIPALEAIVGRLRAAKSEIGARANELERLGSILGPRPPQEAPRFVLLDEAVGRYEAALAELHALGGTLQDLELGLVDFHHQLAGGEVFLCWQAGERAVRHYHALDAGLAGRRPLPAARAT